jgi:hypothetical protein
MNPIDEYIMAKEAAGFGKKVGDFFKSDPGRIAAGAIGTTMATAGLMAAPTAANKVYQAATKRQRFNEMLDMNTDLAAFKNESPEAEKQFNAMYNSLHRLSPKFARDPLVAGSYMRQMTMNPDNAGKVLVESIKGHPASSMPSMGDAWRAGAGAGGRVVGMGIERGMDPNYGAQQRLKGMELQRGLRDVGRDLAVPDSRYQMEQEKRDLELQRDVGKVQQDLAGPTPLETLREEAEEAKLISELGSRPSPSYDQIRKNVAEMELEAKQERLAKDMHGGQ